MQSLLWMLTGLDGMNPVVIGSGVLRVFLQNGLEYGQSFRLAGARLIVVVIAISNRFGQENARLHVFRILLDELAVELHFFRVPCFFVFLLGFFISFGRNARVDIEALRFAGVALQ